MKKLIFFLACFLTLSLAAPILAESDDATGEGPVRQLMNKLKNTATKTQQQKQTAERSRADKEIERRVNSLNNLSSRLENMKKISDEDKSSLQSSISQVISNLNSLKEKIASNEDPQTLKKDLQSIKKEYRVYALVVPRAQILAAANKVNSTADMLAAISQKLRTRISQAPAGADVSSLQEALSDFDAKISDAKTQAQAAISEISGLAPDNGDKNILKSNTETLKDARSKIQAAHKDLRDARKDAKIITQGIKKLGK